MAGYAVWPHCRRQGDWETGQWKRRDPLSQAESPGVVKFSPSSPLVVSQIQVEPVPRPLGWYRLGIPKVQNWRLPETLVPEPVSTTCILLLPFAASEVRCTPPAMKLVSKTAPIEINKESKCLTLRYVSRLHLDLPGAM